MYFIHETHYIKNCITHLLLNLRVSVNQKADNVIVLKAFCDMLNHSKECAQNILVKKAFCNPQNPFCGQNTYLIQRLRV